MNLLPHIINRPPWVTPEIEIQTRKLMSESKLKAVKSLWDIAPRDKEIENSSVPEGKSMTRSTSIVQLKDYIDQLSPIHEVIDELDSLIDQVDYMTSRIEVIKTIEIVNLLNDRFPNLSPEQRVKAASDWDYLKTLIKNTKRATDFGI